MMVYLSFLLRRGPTSIIASLSIQRSSPSFWRFGLPFWLALALYISEVPRFILSGECDGGLSVTSGELA